MAKEKEKKRLKGVGGWMILPMLGFMAEILTILYSLFSNSPMMQSSARISYLIMGLIMIAVYECALIFIFKEKKQAPLFAIIALWAGLGYHQIAHYLTEPAFMAEGAGAIIWTWYFNVSKRVKNTFVK